LSYVENHEPYTFGTCSYNVREGLRARFFRTLPVINPSTWVALENNLFDVIRLLKRVQPNYSKHGPFSKDHGLFNRWVVRYPPSKLKLMKDSHQDPEHLNEFASGVCVKYETNLFGSKRPKPRVFFPKKPTNLAQNGPLMYYVKRKISYIYNGLRTPFIFGSGHTNVSLGAAFEKALPLSTDLISIELDLSMCETTMRGPFLVLEREVYRSFGLTNDECDYLLKHTTSYGTSSKHDLRFKMPFCRESGTANTTVGNTIVFSVCLYAAIQSVGLLDSQWICLIGGDDACIYTSRTNLPLFHRAIKLVSDMGLKPEEIIHDNIYSGRFYGGRMIQYWFPNDNKRHFVHTPLIGRAISKNNVVKAIRTQLLGPWLRDVVQARVYEWGCVPLLSDINEVMFPQFIGISGKRKIAIDYRDIVISKIPHLYDTNTLEQLSVVYNCSVSDLQDTQLFLREHFSGDFLGKPICNDIIELICTIDLK